MQQTTYGDGYIVFVAALLTAAMISALLVGICFFRMFWQAVHAMQMCMCCCCCEPLPPDEFTETEEESRRDTESCADLTVRVIPAVTTPAAPAAASTAAAAPAAPIVAVQPTPLPEAPPVYTLHDPLFLARLKHTTSKEERAALLLEKKKREILLGRLLLERECGL